MPATSAGSLGSWGSVCVTAGRLAGWQVAYGVRDEGGDPGRGTRHAAVRGDRGQAQADGRDRRPPDPLAHHEALRRATASTSSCVALGYKGDVIKRFFLDYATLSGDLTVDLARRHGRAARRRAARTGRSTWSTPAQRHEHRRPRQAARAAARATSTFMLTYGDGVCDVDLTALLAFHRAHGRLATMTAVRPPARFGGLIFDERRASSSSPRSRRSARAGSTAASWSSSRQVFDYIDGDETSFEPTRSSSSRRRASCGRSPTMASGRHGHAARGPVPAVAVGPGRGALELTVVQLAPAPI